MKIMNTSLFNKEKIKKESKAIPDLSFEKEVAALLNTLEIKSSFETGFYEIKSKVGDPNIIGIGTEVGDAYLDYLRNLYLKDD